MACLNCVPQSSEIVGYRVSHCHVVLPTCLGYTRNFSIQRQFAESNARDTKLPHVAARPPGHIAPIVKTRRTTITRELLQRCIITFLFQLPPHGCIFCNETLTFRLSGYRAGLGHGINNCLIKSNYSLCVSSTSCRLTNGMPNAFRSSNASRSVFAVVANVMSIPKILVILSTSTSGNTTCSLIPTV